MLAKSYSARGTRRVGNIDPILRVAAVWVRRPLARIFIRGHFEPNWSENREYLDEVGVEKRTQNFFARRYDFLTVVECGKKLEEMRPRMKEGAARFYMWAYPLTFVLIPPSRVVHQ